MSALSAAASDEDGDTIRALRAENNQLRQSLLAMHTTLEMTAKSGAVYARANEGLRDAVIRWANRAEQAEDMLEAIGAGGVGKMGKPPAVKESLTDEQPPLVEQDWKRRLGNLLAVIHGDGGHYIDAHGWDKAQADAEEKVARVMTGLPVAEQEPVAWIEVKPNMLDASCRGVALLLDHKLPPGDHHLYTHSPPQRGPLSDKELNLIASDWHLHLLEGEDKEDVFEFARAIERAHGIGGEA